MADFARSPISGFDVDHCRWRVGFLGQGRKSGEIDVIEAMNIQQRTELKQARLRRVSRGRVE